MEGQGDETLEKQIEKNLSNPKSLKKKGTLVGTEDYIPPEILALEESGPEADLWSLGVIIFMMLSSMSPFKGQT
jgi:eukaryotic-like serine/threonine-protein kinase